MTNQEAIKFLSQIRDILLVSNSWLPSTHNPIKESFGMAINALTAETHEERTETHSCDCVSRQDAIKVINAVFPVDPMKSEYAQGIACGAALAKTYVEQLPSAQPEPFVDADKLKRCRFEYINACKITHNRTPDTRQSDINDAYAVIKALQPIFGEESF